MPARRSSASRDLAGPEDPSDAKQYVEVPATHDGDQYVRRGGISFFLVIRKDIIVDR